MGHLVTDMNQGALPALLPFFIADHDLSYTAAGGIVFAANMASSIIQPVFGHAADKFSKPWMLATGLILAGLGLGLTGLSGNYPLIMVLVVISGVGIAAYHPEAARLVNLLAGKQKNTAMSIFGVGGTIGFAIGPLLITTSVLQWGLKGTLIVMLPVSVMALLMAGRLESYKAMADIEVNQHNQVSRQTGADNWWAFSRLTLVIIGRSIIFYGLNTFIPVYWINHLHQSTVTGSLALTVFAVSGVIGNLAGGKLADRMGPRTVLLSGFLGLAFFIPAFILVNNSQTALFLTVPIGVILYATYSPSIVMGQNYLPNRVGLSSGITLGVAVSIGGAATPFMGNVADVYGIWSAVAVVAFLPLFFFIVALTLPDPR